MPIPTAMGLRFPIQAITATARAINPEPSILLMFSAFTVSTASETSEMMAASNILG